jgi:integrase
VIPSFGKRPIGTIGHPEVQEWVDELNNRRKPATVRLAHGVFLRMMEVAVKRGRISPNPCRGVNLLPVVNDEKKFLLLDEVALLAGTIDPKYRAYVLVMAYGGLRPGEMAALKPARVDLDESRLRVVENVSEVGGRLVWGPPKTWHGNRTVTLPEEVTAELARHMEMWPGNETVFAAPNGGVLRATSWRRRFWHPAVKKAKLGPLIPYALRDTAIAFWIRTGANLLEVSRRAGHSSSTFTLDKYGHLFPEADSELSGRLSGLYVVPKRVEGDAGAKEK